MTDQGPRSLLPGASMRPRVPYGMTPGVRHILPGINDMSATAYNRPELETSSIPPEKEAQFQQWLKENGVSDLDNPESHYDYRGAFLAGEGRGAGSGHFTDKFKQHGHETFSNESKYSVANNDGGRWSGDKFMPSATDAQKPPNGPPPGAEAPEPEGELEGFELTYPDGNTIRLRSGAHKKRDLEQVQRLGAALMNHATNDAEKETAARAMEWGAAQIGQADIGDITKQMTHVWDMGAGNALKMDLQGMRSKANRGGTGGVPNPVTPGGLPDPLSKFGHTVHKDLISFASGVLREERQSGKYAALSEHENLMATMEQELRSGNGMANRSAVAARLLQLTGKASTSSERAAITEGAGKWEKLKNDLSLWTSGNPSLSDAYVNQFLDMLRHDRAAIAKQKEGLARNIASRIISQGSDAYGAEATRKQAEAVYKAAVNGGEFVPAPTAGAAAPRSGSAPATDEYSDLD